MLSPISEASQQNVPARKKKPVNKAQTSIDDLFAFFMGGKSSRGLALMASRHGGTAVIYCLANRAYSNWQKNKAIGQINSIIEQDIEQSVCLYSKDYKDGIPRHLSLLLIKTMLSASNAENSMNYLGLPALLRAVHKLNPEDKHHTLAAIERQPTIKEIADLAKINEYEAEVYLSAYLAIRIDSQRERAFLNNLAISLGLSKGLPAYLEQQADQGVED